MHRFKEVIGRPTALRQFPLETRISGTRGSPSHCTKTSGPRGASGAREARGTSGIRCSTWAGTGTKATSNLADIHGLRSVTRRVRSECGKRKERQSRKERSTCSLEKGTAVTQGAQHARSAARALTFLLRCIMVCKLIEYPFPLMSKSSCRRPF